MTWRLRAYYPALPSAVNTAVAFYVIYIGISFSPSARLHFTYSTRTQPSPANENTLIVTSEIFVYFSRNGQLALREPV